MATKKTTVEYKITVEATEFAQNIINNTLQSVNFNAMKTAGVEHTEMEVVTITTKKYDK